MIWDREVGGSNPLAPTNNLSKNKEKATRESGLYSFVPFFVPNDYARDLITESITLYEAAGDSKRLRRRAQNSLIAIGEQALTMKRGSCSLLLWKD